LLLHCCVFELFSFVALPAIVLYLSPPLSHYYAPLHSRVSPYTMLTPCTEVRICISLFVICNLNAPKSSTGDFGQNDALRSRAKPYRNYSCILSRMDNVAFHIARHSGLGVEQMCDGCKCIFETVLGTEDVLETLARDVAVGGSRCNYYKSSSSSGRGTASACASSFWYCSMSAASTWTSAGRRAGAATNSNDGLPTSLRASQRNGFSKL